MGRSDDAGVRNRSEPVRSPELANTWTPVNTWKPGDTSEPTKAWEPGKTFVFAVGVLTYPSGQAWPEQGRRDAEMVGLLQGARRARAPDHLHQGSGRDARRRSGRRSTPRSRMRPPMRPCGSTSRDTARGSKTALPS